MVDTHLHTSRPLRAWAVVNLGRARDDQVRVFLRKPCTTAMSEPKAAANALRTSCNRSLTPSYSCVTRHCVTSMPKTAYDETHWRVT